MSNDKYQSFLKVAADANEGPRETLSCFLKIIAFCVKVEDTKDTTALSNDDVTKLIEFVLKDVPEDSHHN